MSWRKSEFYWQASIWHFETDTKYQLQIPATENRQALLLAPFTCNTNFLGTAVVTSSASQTMRLKNATQLTEAPSFMSCPTSSDRSFSSGRRLSRTSEPSPSQQWRPRTRVILLALAFAIMVASIPSSVLAQTNSFNSSWRSVQPEDSLVVRNGEVRLELRDAVSIALARNLGLRIQRYDRAMSLFSVEQRRSIYDLVGTASLNFSDETSPSASQLDGASVQQSETKFLSLRLDQLIRTGATATLDWRNVRSKTNSLFSQINPLFRVDFDVLFSQPLLQGFGKDNVERDIRVAALDAAISMENLELQVVNTIVDVEAAYWSVVEAREQLTVARESLKLTEQLHEQNRIQVEVGTKAPLELIQSEAGIATRQEDIIRNEAAVEDAGDVLRQLLNIEDGEAWLASIVPTTPPQTERIEIDLDSSLVTAQSDRRELRTQQLGLDKLEIDAKFFHNLTKPDLTFDLRYGFNGLGGDILVLAPGASPFDPGAPTSIIPGGYGDALGQIADTDFSGWSVGFNLRYPIQNRGAKANRVIADLNLERGRLVMTETTLGIRTEVRRTARAVLTAAQQIDSAGASRRLEEKNVEAQQKRYENGLATSFEVLEIQEQLSNARSREVSAVTNYRRAVTLYHRAIGRVLEENGIELKDETDPDALRP